MSVLSVEASECGSKVLVDTFRTLFPTEFRYEANRSILFEERDRVPPKELRFCIAMALTYHHRKNKKH